MKLFMPINPDPEIEGKDACIFAFKGEQILMSEADGSYRIPRRSELESLQLTGIREHYPEVLDPVPRFTADYAAGEIREDGREIADAGWFRPENLPRVPGPISIARKLIDAFLEEQKDTP